jgi:hypothetical protein
MHRSNSNRPTGRRYAQVYAMLEHPYKELQRTDRTTRKDAIWLFEQEDAVRAWLATLSQNERDGWTHPSTVRRRYEKRHPWLLPMKKPRSKERPPGKARGPDRRPLGTWTREDLEAYVAYLENQVADRDREIAERDNQLEEQDRTIAQLRNDNKWLTVEAAQLKKVIAPVAAEDVRESREVVPPVRFGKPHYAGMTEKMAATDTVDELVWLQDDNREHIAMLETEIPGAGRGIEQRIGERILQLQKAYDSEPLSIPRRVEAIGYAAAVGHAAAVGRA